MSKSKNDKDFIGLSFIDDDLESSKFIDDNCFEEILTGLDKSINLEKENEEIEQKRSKRRKYGEDKIDRFDSLNRNSLKPIEQNITYKVKKVYFQVILKIQLILF